MTSLSAGSGAQRRRRRLCWSSLALVPLYRAAPLLLSASLFTRIVILAWRRVSLDLILGYGGMVSFGHAAYLGIGAYAVGILAHEGHQLRLRAMAGWRSSSRRWSRW